MIRTKTIILVAVLATFSLSTATAQNRHLSLDALLHLADSGSTELKALRSGTEAEREALTSTRRSTLLPDVRLNAAVGYLGDGYGWGRDSSYHFTVAMPHFSTRFGLEAQQVVYAGGATQAARKQAELGVRLSELSYEQRRQDIRLQLTGLYMDLYRSLCGLEVYDSNIVLTQRLIADIRARREQGTALKNDLTRYELQLANLQMQRLRVENDLAITGQQIATLAGLPQGTRVMPDSSFLNRISDSELQISSSPVIQMADAKSEMADQQVRQSRASMLPYLAVVAQDQLNGPVTIDITPYDINYNYWFVGLALNYDISSLWKTNRAVRSSKLKQEQACLERQTADEQVRQAHSAALIRLDEAHRNLATKQKGLELATENYALVADRYQNDLALLVDMLDAANTKLAAELDLITARIELAYRGYLLDYINGKL